MEFNSGFKGLIEERTKVGGGKKTKKRENEGSDETPKKCEYSFTY